jgi:hypothetical protein
MLFQLAGHYGFNRSTSKSTRIFAETHRTKKPWNSFSALCLFWKEKRPHAPLNSRDVRLREHPRWCRKWVTSRGWKPRPVESWRQTKRSRAWHKLPWTTSVEVCGNNCCTTALIKHVAVSKAIEWVSWQDWFSTRNTFEWRFFYYNIHIV